MVQTAVAQEPVVPKHAASSELTSLPLGTRVVVLVAAALAYGTQFFPSPQLRSWLDALAGHPAYAGPGRVFGHVFLYSTLTAIVSIAVWMLLTRRGWLSSPREWLGFGPNPRATFAYGILSGSALTAFFVGLVAAASAAGVETGMRVGLFQFDRWDAIANLFSNGYEEIIYRGLMLLAIVRVTGSRWIGVLASSVVFGLVHDQYDIVMKATVALGGVIMACVSLRTRSLWSGWTFHMLTDILVPVFIGIPGVH